MKIQWFTVNDNDKPFGQRGSIAKAGRAYLTLWRENPERKSLGASISWAFGRHHVFNARVHIGGEDVVSGVFSLGPVFLSVHFSTGRYHRRIASFDREVGISAHPTFAIVHLFSKGGSNGGKTIRYPIKDWIFGRRKYSKRVVRIEIVALPLFTGATGTITFTESRWERPRWPFAMVRYGAWIDVKRPPAFPGKGENSWDTDDDAIYGMGSDERTVAGVVGDYLKAVLKNRERYGGRLDWQPREEVTR